MRVNAVIGDYVGHDVSSSVEFRGDASGCSNSKGCVAQGCHPERERGIWRTGGSMRMPRATLPSRSLAHARDDKGGTQTTTQAFKFEHPLGVCAAENTIQATLVAEPEATYAAGRAGLDLPRGAKGAHR